MSNEVIIRDITGRVVSRSKNLRGIIAYCRNNTVERIDIYGGYADGTGQLGVSWANGSSVITPFASYRVLCEWVKRRRGFAGVPVKHHTYTPKGGAIC